MGRDGIGNAAGSVAAPRIPLINQAANPTRTRGGVVTLLVGVSSPTPGQPDRRTRSRTARSAINGRDRRGTPSTTAQRRRDRGQSRAPRVAGRKGSGRRTRKRQVNARRASFMASSDFPATKSWSALGNCRALSSRPPTAFFAGFGKSGHGGVRAGRACATLRAQGQCAGRGCTRRSDSSGPAAPCHPWPAVRSSSPFNADAVSEVIIAIRTFRTNSASGSRSIAKTSALSSATARAGRHGLHRL